LRECVFCQILAGAAPASVVYSDEKVLAFLDVLPVNTGHVLVIPKAHAARLSELEEETGAQIFRVAMRVSRGLARSNVRCEGVTLLLADGEAAFQEVPHVHLHVVPRFKGDGFGLKFGPKYGKRPDRKELDAVAGSIREAMRLG
jgi:diadenosine tetraphosphate (Ap4A) HIT family hydrolase